MPPAPACISAVVDLCNLATALLVPPWRDTLPRPKAASPPWSPSPNPSDGAPPPPHADTLEREARLRRPGEKKLIPLSMLSPAGGSVTDNLDAPLLALCLSLPGTEACRKHGGGGLLPPPKQPAPPIRTAVAVPEAAEEAEEGSTPVAVLSRRAAKQDASAEEQAVGGAAGGAAAAGPPDDNRRRLLLLLPLWATTAAVVAVEAGGGGSIRYVLVPTAAVGHRCLFSIGCRLAGARCCAAG